MRVAFWSSLLVSTVAHFSVVGVGTPHRFEINEVEGEGIIPIDIVAGEPEPTLSPPPPPAAPDPDKEPLASTLTRPVTLLRLDAGIADASSDARPGAQSDAASDARADAADLFDGAIAASADAGAIPRDPEAFLGAESMRADVVLVTLVINAEVIRAHPVGSRLGYLLRGIPQWDDFMSGTDIDPVRDTDWVVISGPSLIHTARDMVLIHYAVADRVVDHAVRIVTGKYDRGAPFDAGVPGVKASLVHADRAERVILRPRPHLLAVVPPNVAHRAAAALVDGRFDEHVHPGEAVYLRLLNPHHPMPEVPESITEMRLRVVPGSDAGAEVFIEGDTKDPGTAAQAAEEMRRIVRRHDDAFTSILTHGLLDHVDVAAEGTTVKVHLSATRDQIETVASLVGGFLGVVEPPSSGTGGSPQPSPSPRGPSTQERPR